MLETLLHDQYLFIKVFEDAPIGMSLVSPNGKFLKVNQSFCRMLGYTKDELTKLTINSVTFEDDIEGNTELRHKALVGDIDSYRMEKRYIHKSGKLIWGLLSVSLERDDEGNIDFFISQIVDITELKMKEEELKQTEELHKLISEHSQDIIARSTAEGTLTYVSPAIQKHLGYKPEEMMGKNGYHFWHPMDLNTFSRQNFEDNRTIVHRILHNNGAYYWYETNAQKIRNDSGKIQNIIAISRDITERKHMEEKLQEIEQRHKSLLKYTPVGICSVDREGNFTEVNPAYEQLTGYSSEELLSMNFKELIFSEDIIYIEEIFKVCLERDFFFEGTPLKHKDGSQILCIAWSSPIIINGETAGVYLISKDITEQKQTEELLKKSEKLTMVGELAAGIAHEIRNPLTSLRGFVQLHQMEDKELKNKLRHNVMLTEIDRINEIVSELLVLAKPTNETINLSSVTELLNHVVTLFEGQAHLYNIEIEKDYEEGLPLIHCQSSLKQVFTNVLKNAIESMPEGGHVQIKVKQLGDQIAICFIDQGCGIPNDQLCKVGNPFYTTKETGTGLGLMVSQRIIQNHKGTMHIKSKVGKGTTVEVILPIA